MIVTIVMPVSRKDFLHRIFAQLDMMPCDVNKTNLLVYVDGGAELFNFARNFVVNSKFKEKLCVYRKKGLPADNYIRGRRDRIAAIHNELTNIIGICDYVFLLEDDTLFPLNTMEKLIKSASFYHHAGIISGVQIGRWGMTVPGIWRVDSPYDTQKIYSLLPNKEKPFEEIDACGLYCCFVRADLYKKSEFKSFDTILGPDVYFGLALRREGYKNYVDWSLNTEHLTKTGGIRMETTTLQQITFTKIEAGRWEQELI